MRIMIGTRLVTASLGDRFCPFHHQGAAFIADVAGRTRFNDVFAIRVVRAREEWAEAAASLDHLAAGAALFCAYWAHDAGFGFCFLGRIFLDEFALYFFVIEVGAADESSETTFALDELPVFALWARLANFFWRRNFTPVFAASPEALGEFLTAHETATSGKFVFH